MKEKKSRKRLKFFKIRKKQRKIKKRKRNCSTFFEKKEKKKKRRSFQKEKTMSCQNVRITWKIQKGTVKHWKMFFHDMVRHGERTFARNKLGRKESSGDETTLIEVYAQVAVQKTQFLLHMQSGSSQASMEDSIKLSLLLFGWWDKASASRGRHWPPYRCTALFGTSTVSEHSLSSELVFPSKTAMYWICGTTTGSCTTLSSTIGKLNNSISQTSFGLFSCPFLHPCSSINPTLHHLFPTHTSSFFSESISISKHCKGASTSLQWFGKFFLLVSLDWFFAQALLDTSLSLSWWSFMCSS